MSFILAIVGSREAENYYLISSYITQYIIEMGRIPDRIVSGGATGVDSMARRYAIENNIPFQEFIANWKVYGKSAGPIRNRQIVENSTHVLAFPTGKSVGTRNTISIAQNMNKILTVIEIEPESEKLE